MTNSCPQGTPWCVDHAADLGGTCLGETKRYPGDISVWLTKPPGQCIEVVYDSPEFTGTFPVRGER